MRESFGMSEIISGLRLGWEALWVIVTEFLT